MTTIMISRKRGTLCSSSSYAPGACGWLGQRLHLPLRAPEPEGKVHLLFGRGHTREDDQTSLRKVPRPVLFTITGVSLSSNTFFTYACYSLTVSHRLTFFRTSFKITTNFKKHENSRMDNWLPSCILKRGRFVHAQQSERVQQHVRSLTGSVVEEALGFRFQVWVRSGGDHRRLNSVLQGERVSMNYPWSTRI